MPTSATVGREAYFKPLYVSILSIIMQLSIRLFLTRRSQIFPFRLYSLRAKFKTEIKRKKDMSYSFLPHQKLHFKRGVSWVIYSHSVDIAENS